MGNNNIYTVKTRTEPVSTISRNGMSDEQYINALEIANKVLKSENRRLCKLQLRYSTERRNKAIDCAKCLLKNEN
jgi:hypothetical protein